MNKVLSRILATVLITAMVLGFSPAVLHMTTNAAPSAGPPFNANAPVLFLVGPNLQGLQTFYTNTTGVGTTFVVTAWINTTADEGGWVGAFLFNATQIKCDSVAFVANTSSQSFWTFDNGFYAPGTGVLPFVDSVTPSPGTDNVLGTIGEPTGFGEVLLGTSVLPATSPNVEELITMTFEFKAGAFPECTGTIAWDPAVAFIVSTVGTPEAGVTMNSFVYYTATPPPPPAPNPLVAVTPETPTTFATLTGPSGYDLVNEVVPGTTFVEDVAIGTYDMRQNMVNASVEIDYSNSALIQATAVTFDPAWTSTVSNIGTPGVVTLYGENMTTIPGDGTTTVAFAKITFQIISQQTIPPAVLGAHDTSSMTVNTANTVLYNVTMAIPRNPDVNAPIVDVYAFLSVIPAQFIVTPPLTVEGATGPCVGNTFVVNVTLAPGKSNYIVGAQFVLQYNSTLIKPIGAAEGPDFLNTAAAADNGETTFPNFQFNTNLGTWGPNVLFSDIILPNLISGMWVPPTADNTDVIAEITFQVMYQPPTGTIISPLTIFNDPSASFVVGLSDMVSQNIVYPNMIPPVNAQYEVTTPAWQVGRMIDEYGGAVNSGHGYLLTGTDSPFPVTEGNDWAFPVPYGGQGPNSPMDLVEPQSFVYINAYVSYNGWPVQNKNVAFEITEPDGSLYMKTSAFTDSDGIATIGFRMPWPCDPAQCAALLGKWSEISTVELADVVINDTLNFKYDYIIHIDNVVTDMLNYNHGDTVTVTFNFSSYFMQQFPISLPFPVLIEVSIVDNLGVTVGTATYTTTVGGAVWCTYSHYTGSVQLTIPKWAYAGIATIHVDGFDGLEPVAGGVAITPEYVGPTIAIMPA